MRLFALLWLAATACIVAIAQEKETLTVEWIHSEEGKAVAGVPEFAWLDDNTALLYDSRQPKEQRTFERLDPQTGRRALVLNREKALASLQGYLGVRDSTQFLTWPESFDGSGRFALYLWEGDIYLLDLPVAEFRRVTASEATEKAARFSPDGQKLAFVRDNDLYVYDLVRQTEKRLTFDGSETLLNGTLSWVYWEEIFGRQDIGYWWSGDSKALAFLRTDESDVSQMYFPDFQPAVPRLITQRYPKAGGANPLLHVGIVEIEDPDPLWVELGPPPYEYIVRVDWLPDHRRLCVQTLNREQTELRLFLADRFTGIAALLLLETDTAWVNIHDDLYFLKDGKHFIRASERDGYRHLYRYTLDGTLVNRITRGNWTIHSAGGQVFWVDRAVNAIDEKKGWIYFTAQEKSPLERHLYRIRFDGSGMERLSKGEGFHSAAFSPDARYYFETFSNLRTLPSLSLYRSDGRLQQTLAKPRPELLDKFAPQYPEIFSIPAPDGFPLPAELLKPAQFDPERRYPLIIYVYGGPAAPSVSDEWRSSLLFDNILLQKGYLLARIDPRNATAISKTLENLLLGEMSGQVELADLLAGVRWFKEQTYVDPERVGIWGWSGGGSFTLNAMTRSREFKAGISIAPVTDWHYYDTRWTEFAMKRPQDNPEGYEKTSFVKTAQNLHGRLLLIHGTYDDNVHPQNSWHFIDELIKANVMFDMMFYPMRKHDIGDDPAQIHLYNRMLEFWERNL